MSTNLRATSPEVQQFLVAWHENGRAGFARMCPSLDYDRTEPKTATAGHRWIECANDGSATYLIDRVRCEVWTVTARGRPGRFVGALAQAIAQLDASTATHSPPTLTTYHSNALGRVTIPE